MIVLKLDKDRGIKWTARASARNASLARPVSFVQLSRGKNRLYALCAIIWAALVDRDHDFEAPEDIAEYLKTDEQQLAAFKAIAGMVDEAFPEKKAKPNSTQSTTGHGDSSSSASPPVSPGGT